MEELFDIVINFLSGLVFCILLLAASGALLYVWLLLVARI